MSVQAEALSGPVSRRNPTPEIAIVAGCLIAILTFGPRSAIGVFQLPILQDRHWGGETFSFALAVQYLLWGVGQPFAGALCDRYGSARVLTGGALLYGAGLCLMAVAASPLAFTLTAGVQMGFGLSACSFNLVIGALTKIVPPNMRTFAAGLGTAAGSFGQFLFSPLSGGLIAGFGWRETTVMFGVLMLAVIPLARAVASPPLDDSARSARPQQSMREAIREALGHRSYVLLVCGFFTCGFQLAFVTVHFQKYVVEAGLRPQVGYWAFALVGICNIFGSLLSGYLSGRMPKRWVLSTIYLSRAAVTLAFIMLPASDWTAYAFGALSGFLWLSTVPPTSSLISLMFGVRFFSMLYGFAFLSHQVGGFIGLVLAGFLREHTGSYAPIWWLSIGLGIVSALINLPITEKPVAREAALAPA